MKITLLPYICEAFSINSKIYKDIDELYNKNRFNFYKIAMANKYYDHFFSKQGSVIQDEYFKKTLGIILCSSDYVSEIEKIIKKGWRYEYVFVQNKNKIDLDEYLKAVSKKIDLDNIPTDEFNCRVFMVYFLAINFNKEIVRNKTLSEFEKYLIIRLEDKYNIKNGFNKLIKEDKEKLNKLKLKLFNKYKIKKFSDLDNREIRNTSMNVFLSMLFDYEEISSVSIFENIKFTEKDIEQILYTYIVTHSKDIESYDIENVFMYFVAGMYLKYSIKAYKGLKEYYFKNNRESVFAELEEVQNELNKAKVDILTKSIEISELQKTIEKLEKEHKRLKQQIEENSLNKQELNALREFIFSIDSKEQYPVENIDIEMIRQVKGLIVGGHENWIKRMKELLPNFKFLHCDKLSFDVSILDNVDIILFYTNYLNHGMYYKVINEARKRNIKVDYIKANINENIVLEQIYNIIRKNDMILSEVSQLKK